MRQRQTVRASMTLAVLLVVAGCSIWYLFFTGRTPGSEIRNVVLISIDTCRADRLSCYGYGRKTTPNIDAVASEGVLFTRAHSTNPITLPAHSSMLTGTNPPYHGVHDNHNYRLGDANVTLAEIMRDPGYQTAAFVSAFVLNAQFGLDQGFGTYDDHVTENAGNFNINERNAGDTSRRAVAWLDNHGHEPFFLFLHYFDPHAEYAPPEPYASRFPEAPYAGEIAYTDHCIGQVIEKLKSLGIYDSTLLVITSDHGESLGEHQENTHAYFIYQSTIHVPLIIKAPGCAAQSKLDGPVSIVDVLPTVLGLVGIAQPPQIQGVDLSRSLTDQGEPTQRYLYCESLLPTKYGCNGLFGLIHDQWKYIWTTHPELYDLVHDPAETTNLVDKELEIASKLQARLRNIQLQRARVNVSSRTHKLDRESATRLKSLGYVGGAVKAASLEVDPAGEDPKEFLDHHKLVGNSQALFSKGQLMEAQLNCLEILKKRPRDLFALEILGHIALKEHRDAAAVTHYSQYLVAAAEAIDSPSPRTVVQMTSNIADIHYNLGNSLQALGRSQKAVAHYEEALRLKPNVAEAHDNLGNTLQALGRFEQAVTHYQKSLQLKPNRIEALNNLAWLPATCWREKVRDGRQAVELAKRAARLTEYKNPSILDTLSVAHAEVGDFEQAVQWQEKAVRMAPDEQKVDLVGRLELYKQGKPYREQAKAKSDK